VSVNISKIKTYGVWLYHELLPKIGGSRKSIRLTVDDHQVSVKGRTKRLRMFKTSPVCVKCGRRGSVWLLQSNNGYNPHLNLYAHEPNDTLCLMTIDHIYPQSLGGLSCLENSQVMCSPCNQAKGDSVVSELDEIDHEYIRLWYLHCKGAKFMREILGSDHPEIKQYRYRVEDAKETTTSE
jgi:5-methylcytosine-specific restriction endonuclease McrA